MTQKVRLHAFLRFMELASHGNPARFSVEERIGLFPCYRADAVSTAYQANHHGCELITRINEELDFVAAESEMPRSPRLRGILQDNELR